MGARDFDFFLGNWNVANRRLKDLFAGCQDWDEFPATSICRGLLGGHANVDEFDASARGFHGMTLRLFEPERDQWSLYWANSTTGVLFPPVAGRFSGGRGDFYGDDTHDGQPIRVHYIWSMITPTSCRWEQAFSIDGEQTWETNWYMDFTRVP